MTWLFCRIILDIQYYKRRKHNNSYWLYWLSVRVSGKLEYDTNLWGYLKEKRLGTTGVRKLPWEENYFKIFWKRVHRIQYFKSDDTNNCSFNHPCRFTFFSLRSMLCCPCSVSHDINGQLILGNAHLLTFEAIVKVIQLLGKVIATATGHSMRWYINTCCTTFTSHISNSSRLVRSRTA